MTTPTPANLRDTPITQAPILGLQKGGPSSQRLLLQVEDNAANADVIAQVIARRSDLKLLTAMDGYQGIEMANFHQPAVILMDMKMPGMNGMEAFVLLRNNPATAHIPVIALSSSAYKAEINHCLDAGFFSYITKPFNIVELMGVIDAALDFGKAVHLAK